MDDDEKLAAQLEPAYFDARLLAPEYLWFSRNDPYSAPVCAQQKPVNS